MRDSGAWGTQLIEPIAQIVVGAAGGRQPELTSIRTRTASISNSPTPICSGSTASPGSTGWTAACARTSRCTAPGILAAPRSTALIGQSYRTTQNNLFPEPSGLHDQVSDVVARASFAPTGWLNLTYRTRLDHKTFATRMADALATVGVPKFSVTAGYIYSTFNPYTFFDQPPPPPAGNAFFTPRNEITLGASSNWGRYRFSGWARRNLQRTRWWRSAPTLSTRTSATSWICGSIRRYTSYQWRQRRDDAADPDDLQDGRTVRLQGALTIGRPRSWPTHHPHGCALGVAVRAAGSRRSL